jgi:hypothetical protein
MFIKKSYDTVFPHTVLQVTTTLTFSFFVHYNNITVVLRHVGAFIQFIVVSKGISFFLYRVKKQEGRKASRSNFSMVNY